MATNSDANLQSISVKLDYTKPLDGCVPEGVYEALERMNLRFNLPLTVGSSGGNVFASALQNNTVYIDPEGGIYVPAIQVIQIPETTISLLSTDAPGTEKTAFIATPGLSDPINALRDIRVFLNPSSAAVNMTSVTAATGTQGQGLRIGFTRVDYGQSSPYTPVEITVTGLLWQVAQPTN
jgi:hypothetical protein